MKKLLTILALMLVAFTANAQIAKWMKPSKVSSAILKGDTNGDGEITVADVMLTVNYVLGKESSSFNSTNADVNGDGEITIADVMQIVDKIIQGSGDNGGTSKSYLTCPDDHHPHLIDLGLPSGTLWSCCNVDANNPEDYGGYYAWGETESKSSYGWDNYIHCDGSLTTCYDLGSDIVGTEYDVAHVKWGGDWVMPSYTQQQELLDNCKSTWTTQNGVSGKLFTGTNGGSIFLPAAGCHNRYYIDDAGSYGYYWSSTLSPSRLYSAYALYIGLRSTHTRSVDYRCSGLSVRPVAITSAQLYLSLYLSCNSIEVVTGQSETVEITSGNGSYEVTSSDATVATATLSGTTVTITGNSAGTATVTVKDVPTGSTKDITVTVIADKSSYLNCPDDHHPHMIDLGLPSGTKWACCNVDTDHPENQSPTNYGGYYAWGETEEKDVYDWNTYIHCDGSEETCHDLGSDIAGTQYDVAHVKWGGSWVMPSNEQIEELLNNCTYEWAMVNGVYGGMFTSNSNNGCVFLPATGHRQDSGLWAVSSGDIWSSTQSPYDSYNAYHLCFRSGTAFTSRYYGRHNGHTVRPVSR